VSRMVWWLHRNVPEECDDSIIHVEDGGNTFLWNSDKYLLDNMVWHPRWHILKIMPWEPQILWVLSAF